MKLKLILLFLITSLSYSQIGVGIKNPVASAALDVTATNMGFVAPRMTTAQRDAIVAPLEGLMIFNSTKHCYEWFQGKIWYNVCEDGDVVIGGSGKKWYPWNVGANHPADNQDDYTSYGSLIQWGRGRDGHELINWIDAITGVPVNGVTSTLSTTDNPGHTLFISGTDWRSPKNDNLWQSYAGVNNPCEPGFRLPTTAEWHDEMLASNITDITSSFNSVLRLTAPGYRNIDGTMMNSLDVRAGYYWTSTVSGANANYMSTNTNGIMEFEYSRGAGFSVRCLKD